MTIKKEHRRTIKQEGVSHQSGRNQNKQFPHGFLACFFAKWRSLILIIVNLLNLVDLHVLNKPLLWYGLRCYGMTLNRLTDDYSERGWLLMPNGLEFLTEATRTKGPNVKY